MDFFTADLCDEYQEDDLQVLDPILNSYGGVDKCRGKIVTIELNEDNSALISLLKENGEGKVAVVNVKGNKCAVVGDTLMGYAKKNNWGGIILNGYVRDIINTKNIDVALYALGTYPKKSKKKAEALKEIDLTFGNVTFHNGDYLYADNDGIIVVKEKIK